MMVSSSALLFLLLSRSLFVDSLSSGYPQDDIGDVLTRDADIQDALVGIVKQSHRECPIVLIFDEQMPELSVSHKFMHRMHKHWRILIIINFSADKLPEFEIKYGTTDTTLILQKILHSLYRRYSCYLFIVWLKDPRILYPETSDYTNPAYTFNPGWRQTDKVILVVHHITKRYKSLISLRFWDFIPKIIGVKRGVKLDSNGIGFEVRLFTVLPFLTNGKRVSKEINTWLVKEKRFNNLDSELFIDRFRNLNMANIKLGVFWQEPFFIWGTIEDPYLDGLDWRIFKLCQKYLNFTFSLTIVNSTGRLIQYQDESNNSTNVAWTGMMKMISDGIVDVGLGGLPVTSERLSFFDFCRTYYTDSFVFISPHDHNPNSAINTLEQPFHEYVWVTLFCTSLVGMITLQVVTILQQKIFEACHNKDEHFQDSHFKFAGITAGFILTTICQKPFRLLPKSFSVQCVYYGTSLTIFVLGMAYSSCLISVFLSLKTYPVVEKIQDIHKTGLPISIKRYDGYLDQYMENSPNRFISDLYKKADFVDYFTSIQAINEVVHGKRIHIDSKARVLFTGRYRYDSTAGLKFHVSSDAIVQFANLGWPCQKHWPLMSKFDSIISRAVESGVVEFWMGEFVKGKFGGDDLAWKIPPDRNLSSKVVGVIDHDQDGHEIHTGGYVPLSEKHVSGLITLYNTGAGISIVVFIVECTLGTLLFLMGKIKLHFLMWWNRRSQNRIPIPPTQKLKTVAANRKELPQLVWSDFNSHKYNNFIN